ncbi:MAG: DUF480 domain-containing protein [Pirellulales bacterium]|nr:DUF480 domain-containing protein [Pirellulales bacterium]
MTDESPRWQPIGAIDRRVIGVLAEKAKTTPDAYPMSLNAISSACNQKSNRDPLMQLEPEDVEESLERLRPLGAVGMIEGYGRVTKYRHYLYEWLAVDKVELAVMAELLLRGAQTEGLLRGRAARMEPIADLTALRPILSSLKAKGLVIPLTPEGRGHVVSHALYQPRELERIKAQYGGAPTAADAAAEPTPRAAAPAGEPRRPQPPAVAASCGIEEQRLAALRHELEDLRSQVAELRSDQQELAEQVRQNEAELQRLRDALGG